MTEITILGLFFIYVGVIVSSIFQTLSERLLYKLDIEDSPFNRLCSSLISLSLILVVTIILFLFIRSELLLFSIFGIYVNIMIQITDKLLHGLELLIFYRKHGSPYSLSTRSIITGNPFKRYYDISLTESYYHDRVIEISREVAFKLNKAVIEALGNLSREYVFSFCKNENVSSPYLTWDIIREMNRPIHNRPKLLRGR